MTTFIISNEKLTGAATKKLNWAKSKIIIKCGW